MPNTSRSSVQRVFENVDIQEHIYGIISRADNARCARVCRQWHDLALDHVWRQMTALTPLFRLLAPLEIRSESESSSLHFSRDLRPNDWKRYTSYSKRVKSLDLSSAGETLPIDESVFFELARSRRALHLLPNASTLKLRYFQVTKYGISEAFAWMKHCVLLLHEGVRTLEIDFNICTWFSGIWPSPEEIFLDEIAEWSPYLSSFTVNGGSYLVKGHFPNFLSRLACLETINIKQEGFIPRMIDALAPLPSLKSLTLRSFLPGYTENGLQTLRQENAFPRLQAFVFEGGLNLLSGLFATRSGFRNLFELTIYDNFTNTIAKIQNLFAILPSSAPCLSHLTVNGNRSNIQRPVQSMLLDRTVLEPLGLLTKMEKFEYTLVHSIVLTDVELVNILGRWSSLRTLVLNWASVLSPHASTCLTLAILPMLAKACPALSNLRLFIDAGSIPVDLHQLRDYRFRRLATLDFGGSRISDTKDVAMYLSHVLPKQCTLVTSDRNQCSVVNNFATKWKEVGELLPFFIRSREASDSALRIMEIELEAARVELEAMKSRFRLLAEGNLLLRKEGHTGGLCA